MGNLPDWVTFGSMGMNVVIVPLLRYVMRLETRLARIEARMHMMESE
ncbi:hypothetical protein [Cupriavidus oxalaticus]